MSEETEYTAPQKQKEDNVKPSNARKERWQRWRRPVLRSLLVLGCLCLVLFAVLLIRTLRFASKQISAEPVEVTLPPAEEMIGRLAMAVRIPTVSSDDAPALAEEFAQLHQHLAASFPLVHEKLQVETVSSHSLLYTWPGSDPSLPGLLFAGHMDVVPAYPSKWSHPPYEGAVKDGFLYGRGTLDDKVAVLATLEAGEQLLRDGFAPKRTVYFAFGHDEEIGGYEGAAKIAELLESRGVKLEAVFDEGLVITEGILDGISQPLAIIGVAEKGYMDVKLTARAEGGHSSMPTRDTAVGILSRAIVAIESDPLPASLEGPAETMLEYIGPEFGFGRKLVMANLWLFGPIVERTFSKKPSTDALLRTTVAPTQLQGSPKSNVLAQTATAVLNLRIKPGDSCEGARAQLVERIDDSRVTVESLVATEPQAASSLDSRAYKAIERNLRGMDQDILVAPGLMVAMTDSRHYSAIAEDIYRFTAMRMGADDLVRLHGVDERIGVDNYREVVTLILLLMRELGGSEA